MKLKKWILIFITFMIITSGIVGGFNVVVDPFGAFGDSFYNWFAYDMTNNPRASKIAYLEKHHNEYDSYIIGGSKTSSYSVDELNKYYGGAKFYNMIMYGGDMYDIELTALYIIKNYNPKNIIINIGVEEASVYNKDKTGIKNMLDWRVSGMNPIEYYGQYFLMNPEYSSDKINRLKEQGYLPSKYNVFVPQTGAYNKAARDSQAIGELDSYLTEYPGFTELLGNRRTATLDDMLGSISRVKAACESRGITHKLIVSPVYFRELLTYPKEDLTAFWTKLADVTDFWDFSGYTPISFEPRYFYDEYHFRNSVGSMVLSKIFGDNNIYKPDNFGFYVTKDNVAARAKNIFNNPQAYPAEKIYSQKVPVLAYHNIDNNASDFSGYAVTSEKFRAVMSSLKAAGYTTIFYKDLVEYVDNGKELPPKPVVITFDDGYMSNYDFVFPTLKELGMCATISVVGVSVGKDKYKDTDYSIIPHFSYAQAKEMYDSGVIDIQSHTYSMHDSEQYDADYRDGTLQKPGESEADYVRAFTEDLQKSRETIEANVGAKVLAYTYPHGLGTKLSEALLTERGIRVTVTTQTGINTIIKGLPQSLLELKRISIENQYSGQDVITLLNSFN